MERRNVVYTLACTGKFFRVIFFYGVTCRCEANILRYIILYAADVRRIWTRLAISTQPTQGSTAGPKPTTSLCCILTQPLPHNRPTPTGNLLVSARSPLCVEYSISKLFNIPVAVLEVRLNFLCIYSVFLFHCRQLLGLVGIYWRQLRL